MNLSPIALVGQMLVAVKPLAEAQSDKDNEFYTNRCDGLNHQIDALTPGEIEIVEGAAE